MAQPAFQRWVPTVAAFAMLVSLGPRVAAAYGETGAGFRGWRFDMGTAQSPLAKGFVRIASETAYARESGYGWETPPEGAFDRPEPFKQDWERVEPHPLTRDGVASDSDIVFRVDVPPGEYALIAWIGDTAESRRRMNVEANGQVVASGVSTETGWGGTLTVRGMRALISVTDGVVRVRCWHEHMPGEKDEAVERNSLLGLEIAPRGRSLVVMRRGWLESVGENAPAELEAIAAAARQGRRWEAAAAVAGLEGPNAALWRAWLYLWLADDLYCTCPEELAKRALAELRKVPRRDAASQQLAYVCHQYEQARAHMKTLSYTWANERTGVNGSKRRRMAEDALARIQPGEPLYDQAQFNIGRLHYWEGRESGSAEEYRIAREHFAALRPRYPGHRLLRMYVGEKVRWGTGYEGGAGRAPRWAHLAREALCRVTDVFRWWIENRQQPNGEMGGGWGDDVEMLRSWPVGILAADDPVIRAGWLRLADGVWEESGIVARGYDRQMSDVQHSAEPTSDSQPMLIGLEYGDPLYVERCMETAALMRDCFTGVNARGHRHFKSSIMGAFDTRTGAPHGVDLPYHARAAKAGLWLGWYSGNPAVMRLYREWGDAWVEDTAREENGKPAGVLPAAVAYATDRIGGYGRSWWDPGLYWSYFRFPGGTSLMYENLVGIGAMTGNEKYYEPVHSALALAREALKQSGAPAPQGSRRWAALAGWNTVRRAASKWRVLTGETAYDDLLAQGGAPYVRWLLTGDKKHLEEGCLAAIGSTKYNFELLTSEVLYTDRVSVLGTDDLVAMYTGGAGLAGYYPAYAVSWQTSTRQFAALVTSADERHVRLLAYSFELEPREFGLRFWRLAPGRYVLRIGPDADENDVMDQVQKSREVVISHRGDGVRFLLPSERLTVIEIEQEEAFTQTGARPDLAVLPRDIALVKVAAEGKSWRVDVTVHNIGNAPATDVEVTLRERTRIVGRQRINLLEAPNDLAARRATVPFFWDPRAQPYSLRAAVHCEQDEICITNNQATRSLPERLQDAVSRPAPPPELWPEAVEATLKWMAESLAVEAAPPGQAATVVWRPKNEADLAMSGEVVWNTGGTEWEIAPARRHFDVAARQRGLLEFDVRLLSEDVPRPPTADISVRWGEERRDIVIPLRLTNDWFAREYMVIGPFDLGTDGDEQRAPDGFDHVYPPEAAVDFSKSYPGLDGETVSWKRAQTWEDGYLDLASEFPPHEKMVSYACCYVVAPSEMQRTMLFGSNDGAKVWVNGKLVYSRHIGRRAEQGQERIPIRLRAGRNTVLVKVENLGAAHGLYLAIPDLRGPLGFTLEP